MQVNLLEERHGQANRDITPLALLLSGAASMLSACNTMEGAGQDIQQGGKALEDSADRDK